MLPPIPEHIWQESMRKTRAAYGQAEEELSDAPTTFLAGYIAAYEDAGVFHRLGSLVHPLGMNHVRYEVACRIVEERELGAMGDTALVAIADNEPSFFASWRKIDRWKRARDILKQRTSTSR